MLDISWVINELTSANINALRSKYREPTLTSMTNLPVVFVGYVGFQNETNTIDTPDIYPQHVQDFIQVFETQIVCAEEDFVDFWLSVKDALLGKNPSQLEQNFSSINYVEGGVMGLDSGKLWWTDRWKISTPITLPA